MSAFGGKADIADSESYCLHRHARPCRCTSGSDGIATVKSAPDRAARVISDQQRSILGDCKRGRASQDAGCGGGSTNLDMSPDKHRGFWILDGNFCGQSMFSSKSVRTHIGAPCNIEGTNLCQSVQSFSSFLFLF